MLDELGICIDCFKNYHTFDNFCFIFIFSIIFGFSISLIYSIFPKHKKCNPFIYDFPIAWMIITTFTIGFLSFLPIFLIVSIIFVIYTLVITVDKELYKN